MVFIIYAPGGEKQNKIRSFISLQKDLIRD